MKSSNKTYFRKIIRETIEHMINIYNPDYYLDDFYSMDFNNEIIETKALSIIQGVIDEVKNFKYPMTVYRGINSHKQKEGYENSSWSRQKQVAQGFGDKLSIGIVPNSNIVDIEQTIRTRIMNPGEDEIYIPDSNGITINA